jgi:hypothetical protein
MNAVHETDCVPCLQTVESLAECLSEHAFHFKQFPLPHLRGLTEHVCALWCPTISRADMKTLSQAERNQQEPWSDRPRKIAGERSHGERKSLGVCWERDLDLESSIQDTDHSPLQG